MAHDANSITEAINPKSEILVPILRDFRVIAKKYILGIHGFARKFGTCGFGTDQRILRGKYRREPVLRP